jgi:hypothetical protein
MLLFCGFWSTSMDLLPRLFPELKAFYCHDTLTKVIDCDSIDDCLMFLTSIFTF